MSSKQRVKHELVEYSEEVLATIMKLYREQRSHEVSVVRQGRVIIVKDARSGEVIAKVSKEPWIPNIPCIHAGLCKVERLSSPKALEQVPFLRVAKTMVTWINVPELPKIKVPLYPELALAPPRMEPVRVIKIPYEILVSPRLESARLLSIVEQIPSFPSIKVGRVEPLIMNIPHFDSIKVQSTREAYLRLAEIRALKSSEIGILYELLSLIHI